MQEEPREIRQADLTPSAPRTQKATPPIAAPNPEGPIPRQFFQLAAQIPQHIALFDEHEGDIRTTTYQQLALQAKRVAQTLHERGITPETAVAVCMERGPRLVATLLGILEAGAAYVPLDPAYPATRLAYMLRDSGAPLLLCDRSRAWSKPTPYLLFDDILAETTAPSHKPPIHDQNLAYIIYTSGSTGQPKGVTGTHRAIIERCRWMHETFPFATGEICCQKTALSFVDAVWEIFGPLLRGIPNLILPDSHTRNPERLLESLAKNKVSRIVVVPSLLRALLNHEPKLGKRVPHLQLWTCSGEALPNDLAGQFYAAHPKARLLNLYGSSEVCGDITAAVVPPQSQQITIGKPISRCGAVLLNETLQAVPNGDRGELVVHGPTLTRGYHERPALTALRLIPNPFSQFPGDRLFRTGDLARWDPESHELLFEGRLDQQIKLRGFRIETGEIEHALRGHEWVTDCLVGLVEGAMGPELAAWTLLDTRSANWRESLHAHLTTQLPAFMIPGWYIPLQQIPMTPNGKVDRNQLPSPTPQDRCNGDEQTPLTTETQKRLAAIWQELLRSRKPGKRSHFFRSGGHSLLALRLSAAVAEQFSVDLPLEQIFSEPYLDEQAALIERLPPCKPEEALPQQRGQHVPLSFSQQRLWFLDKLAGGSPAYHIKMRNRLVGPLDCASLVRAVGIMTERHENLRTSFPTSQGLPIQRIDPHDAAPIPLIDLSGLPPEQRTDVGYRLIAREATSAFHLAEGPLIRFRIIRLGPTDHLFLVTVHHIIADGWSMGLIREEISSHYRHLVLGTPPLPRLPLQFADVASQQHQQLHTRAAAQALDYWLTHLRGAPQLIELPLDRPRPARRDARGGTRQIKLTRKLFNQLEHYCLDHNVTPFMVMLTAFSALLQRLTGQNDFLVGTPVANRGPKEHEALIGFFVNTLVLRMELNGRTKFSSGLEHVRKASLGALIHQTTPFEQIVEALNPERDPSYNPLFQVMFVFQNAEEGYLNLPGLKRHSLTSEDEEASSKFDLLLSISPEDDTYLATFTYPRDIYDPSTIARYATLYIELLDNALTEPNAEIAHLLPATSGITTPAILADSYRPPHKPVYSMFFDAAASHPNKAAIVQGQRISYQALLRAVEALAHALEQAGLQTEELVAITSTEPTEVITAMLAILAAGGAYAVLDPQQPEQRLQALLDKVSPRLILGPTLKAAKDVTYLAIEQPTRQTDYQPKPRDPDNFCYLYFTSGSTGEPKAIAGRLSAIDHFVQWQTHALQLDAEMRVSQLAPPTFDALLKDVFVPLCYGGTLCIPANREMLLDPQALVTWLAEARVSVFQTVPSLFRTLLDEEIAQTKLPHLRWVVLAGERLFPRDIENWHRFYGTTGRIANFYGPSETTLIKTAYLTTPEDAERSNIPIGKPIWSTTVAVVDEHGHPCLVGATGEIWIQSHGSSLGYYRASPEIETRFIENVESFEPGLAVYRTGDLGRLHEDGQLEYIGRTDHQVKIRGVRIELAEIERALLAHPYIADAAALTVGEADHLQLAAYICVSQPTAEAAVIEHLRDHLPTIMMPSHLHILDKLPRGTTNKVDRLALARLAKTKQQEDIPPQTLTQELLSQIYGEVLDRKPPGIHGNFFFLGGHSLLAIRVISRIQEAFGAELSLATFFETPTIAELATLIERKRIEQQGIPELEAHPIPRVNQAPLTHAQQRLWFLHHAGADRAYNLPILLDMEGPLHLLALEAAVDHIYRVHPMLRARIEGTPPQQTIAPHTSHRLRVTELPVTEETLLGQMRRISQTPFELEGGSLSRVNLLRFNANHHILTLTMHHLISDDQSQRILLADLKAAYQAQLQHRQLEWHEATHDFIDYAAWTRTAEPEAQLTYWQHKLADAPRLLPLPNDQPRPAQQDYRGSRHVLYLDEKLTHRLKQKARQQQVTPYMLLLAAYSLLLSRLSDCDDVVVGTPITQRNRREWQNMVGFFANTAVVRLRPDHQTSFTQFLDEVRREILDAHAHADLPFEQIVGAVAAERAPDHTPLFQALFVYASRNTRWPQWPGLETSLRTAGEQPARFDLTLSIRESGPRLRCAFTYAAALFTQATVQRWGRAFEQLLKGLLEAPEQALHTHSLLDETSKQEVAEAAERTGVTVLDRWGKPQLPGVVGTSNKQSVRLRTDLSQLEAVNRQRFAGYIVDIAALERQLQAMPATETVSLHIDQTETLLAEITAGNTTNAELQRRLERSLPRHLVPRLTTAEAEPVATETLETLRTLWQRLLQLEHVANGDNFFRLGGDSILGIQMVSEARNQGISLNALDLFHHQTLIELAGATTRFQQEDTAAQVNYPLVRLNGEQLDRLKQGIPEGAKIEDIYPLTPMQEAVLYGALYGQDLYKVQRVYRMEGRIDSAGLAAKWQAAIDRHGAARTTFVWRGLTRPLQVVLSQTPLQWQEIQQQQPPGDAELEKLLAQEREGLEPGPHPPIRFLLLKDREGALLVWSFHHLMLDGWSIALLAEEAMNGIIHHSPPFAAYLRHLQQRDEATTRTFWQEELGKTIAPAPLPGNLHGPEAGYGELRQALSREDTDRLRALAQREAVTLNTLVQLAWGLMLAAYGDSEHVVFGATVTGRNVALRDIDKMVGMLIHTLPVSLNLGAGNLSDLLQQMATRQAAREKHGNVSLQEIARWLELPADRPLFESLLVYQNFPATHTSPSHGYRVLRSRERTGLPLTASIRTRTQLVATLIYDQGRFDRPLVEAMSTHFLETLRSISQDKTLAELTQAQPIAQLESPALPEMKADLYGNFANQVARTPEAIALIHLNGKQSYRQLHHRVNRISHALKTHGVEPGQRIGICTARGPQMIEAVLAVLERGATYVPLDPAYPQERLDWIARDARLALILCDEEGQTQSPAGTTALRIDQIQEPEAGTLARPEIDPETPAYVLYTSGSTGRPKGVLISQRGPTSLIGWAQQAYTREETAVVAAGTSLNFDLSIFELFVPLTRGGTVVLLDNLPALHEHPHADAITLINTVPSAAEALLSLGKLPRALRCINLAGEPLAADLVNRLLQQVPRVANLYGPSEDSTYSTEAHFRQPLEDTPPIGTALAGKQAHVLGANLHRLPAGATGELYLSGPGLATCYLDKPALTAERFLPNPYTQQPGDRLYRSGDRVRHELGTPGHPLQYLGRVDRQIKLRGYRIELPEIESVLATHPQIKAAAVHQIHAADGRPLLEACYEAETPQKELHDWLAARLPHYMVPARYRHFPALPRNANGKIDYAALGQAEAPQQRTTYRAPRDAREALLAQAWGEALELERVGIDDNFFELGGDSIIAMRIAARLTGKLYLTPHLIFSQQTIAAIARATTQSQTPTKERVTGEVALTPIQRWFFQGATQQPHHFNQSRLLEVEAGIRPQLLAETLQVLADHHDGLRLHYKQEAGSYRQAYRARAPIPLQVIDLDEPTQIGQPCAQAQASLDLEHGPLMRALLINLPEQNPRLFLVAHHLIIDTVSWQILLDDLATVYTMLARGETASLPPKTTSFASWTHQLVRTWYPQAAENEWGYWNRIAEHEPLPTDTGRRHATVGETAHLVVRLDSAHTEGLIRGAAREYGSRVDEVLIYGLTRALCDTYKRDTLLINQERHGREMLLPDLDLTRTTGWFTSLFPLQLQLTEPTPEAGLRAVMEQMRAVPHGGIGYGLVCEHHPQGAELAARTRADICLNYLGRLGGGRYRTPLIATARGARGAHYGPRDPRRHLLDINAFVRDGQLVVDWSYATTCHHEQTIRTLASRMLAAIEELVANLTVEMEAAPTKAAEPLARPGEKIQRFDPLSPTQAGLLFHALSAQGVDYYVIQRKQVLHGPLDILALQSAWQRVIDRHPMLRTRFAWKGTDEPYQLVLDTFQPSWTVVEGIEAASLLHDDRRLGFDLEEQPPLRFFLLRQSPTRHLIIWSYHHILLDGWSVQIIDREVRQHYTALITARPQQQPAVAPYSAYLDWLRGHDNQTAQTYWRTYLEGIEGATPLPAWWDSPQNLPPEAPALFPERVHTLSTDQANSLRTFTRTHRLTLSTVFQGLWSLLLAHYTNSREVVFGTTVSGRPVHLPGVFEMVGLFINTIPVRVRLSQQSAQQWLTTLQEDLLTGEPHGFLPLARIQKVAPVRGKLFETLLIVENYPRRKSKTHNLLKTSNTHSLEATNYPLTLLVDDGVTVHFTLSYDPRYYTAVLVDGMLRHLDCLLASLCTDAARKPAQLPMIPAEERARMISDWNQTQAPFPDRYLHQLVEDRVAAQPEAIALVFEDRRVSYATLNRMANQLAHRLREQGFGPEQVVGICLERSVEMVVSVLGVMKAGAAYLPLEPYLPDERIAMMIEDARTQLVIVSEVTEKRIQAPVLKLDLARLSGDAHNPEPPQHVLTMAYVIFTSGSTGRPKGTINSHRGIVNYIHWLQQTFSIAPDEAVMLKTPFGFDVSVWEFFWTLHAGARLVIAKPGGHRDPIYTAELIEQHTITTAHFVPSMLRLFLDSGATDRCGSLRRMVCSGEDLTHELRVTFFKCFDSRTTQLINLYGPTEAAVDVTGHVCEDITEGVVTIGRPLNNTTCYIVDIFGELCAQGAAGELLLGGTNLGRGYIFRGDISADRFIPDPYAGVAGERLYRTGDLARYMPTADEPEILFMGRLDRQIKLRGQRIELPEIETALEQHPDLKAIAVIMREDTPGHQYLAAYVVPLPDCSPTVAELREHLARHVPEYMIPSVFVFLEAMPLNSSEKVNLKALPAPESLTLDEDRDHVAPRNPIETVLTEIWRDVLGLDQIGVTENFFELGGDSILSIQVAARAHRHGLKLTPVHVFEHATIAELAQAVETAEQVTNEAPRFQLDELPAMLAAAAVDEQEIETAYPLSPMQEGMLFHALRTGSVGAYFQQRWYTLDGELDLENYREAWRTVIAQHAILRTGFLFRAGKRNLQIVYRETRPSWQELDWQDSETFETRLEHFLSEDRLRELPIARPPLRLTLIAAPGKRHVLVWSYHHLLLDGWSVPMVNRHVMAAYRAIQAGKPWQAPEAPSFARYIHWLETQDSASADAFWRDELAGVYDTTELGLFRGRPEPKPRIVEVDTSLDETLTEQLREFARNHQTTVNALVQAAWSLLLSRNSGADTVLFGTTVSGRYAPLAGIEKMAGLLINTLPVRVTIPREGTMGAWLQALAKRQAERERFAYCPLVEIRKQSTIAPQRPLFHSLVVFENYPPGKKGSSKPTGLRITRERFHETAEYPLSLLVHARRTLDLTISYDAAVLNRATQELPEQLTQIFTAMLQQPKPQALRALSAETITQLFHHETGPNPAVPQTNMHRWFETICARNGAQSAIICKHGEQSYADLWQRAMTLAARLAKRGIQPGDRVGVLLERDRDWPMAILAILARGAIYVPLDPQLPGARLAYMVEDAAIRLVLTHHNALQDISPKPVNLLDLSTPETAFPMEPVTVPANAPAYIIYTSGTTGKPKGTAISHESWCSLATAIGAAIPIGNRSRVLQASAISFDASAWELAMAQCHGATLVIPSEEAQLPGRAFTQLLADQRISHVTLTPSALAALEPQPLPALQHLIVAGEACPTELAHRWASGRNFYNAYGPTEATVCATLYTGHGDEVPIGKPIAGARVHVLNPCLERVAPGVAGQISIAGKGLAQGYLNQPARTAVKFVPNPFTQQPGARLYLSGDLARWDSLGYLHYLGRADQQVKLRGHRIELGEVEHSLAQLPEAIHAAVILERKAGNERLVGFVQVTHPQQHDAEAARTILAQRLPRAMVPSRIVFTDHLPLTPAGKVDRAALVVPERTETVGERPHNETQRLIAAIWCELLGIEQAGIHHNFFDLGGHSILLVKVYDRLLSSFSRLTLIDLLTYPTIYTLAQHLTQGDGNSRVLATGRNRAQQRRSRTAAYRRKK